VKTVVIGRGHVGGGLAPLSSGHGRRVAALGRDGDDATDAKIVVIAVAAAQIPGADLVARKSIAVPIAADYDFSTEQVRQAYHHVSARHVGGKRVLRIMPADEEARQT
jgi:prephenate dehydrogenase